MLDHAWIAKRITKKNTQAVPTVKIKFTVINDQNSIVFNAFMSSKPNYVVFF